MRVNLPKKPESSNASYCTAGNLEMLNCQNWELGKILVLVEAVAVVKALVVCVCETDV